MNQSYELFVSATKQVWEYCQSEITSNDLSAKRKSTLGEAGIVIYEIINSLDIMPIDRILIEKVFNKIAHIIYDEEALFYYSSFYYSYQNVKSGVHEAQNHFIKANLDILAMRLKIRLIEIGVAKFGNSTDEYFLSRLERLIWGIKYVFNKKCADLYVPALYTATNLHQALIELFESKFIEENTIITKLKIVHNLLLETVKKSDIEKTIADSVQLNFFIIDQYRRFQVIEGQKPSYNFSEFDFKSLDWIPQFRSLYSLSLHEPEKFTTLYSQLLKCWCKNFENMVPVSIIWLTSNITQYLKITNFNDQIILDLDYPASNLIDLDEVMLTYFSAYRAIPDFTVAELDLDKLSKLNDDELRIRVGKSMINIDRVVVEREARKPHGVSEIADMEIPVKLQSGKTHYLCMPFKSALEIRQAKVPVDYSYQILRPFTFFDNCIVVFISAKKCSQPLMNIIKQMREKFNWPIGVLQHSELAALLKLNGYL